MSNMPTQEVLEMTTFEHALAFHLQSRCFPPVPLEAIEPFTRAIRAQASGRERLITLPEGMTYRGRRQAPASAIIKNFRLEPFVENLLKGETND